MVNVRLVTSALLLLLFLHAACAPQAPVPQATAAAPARLSVPPLAAPAKPAWQDEWDKVLSAARQEGKVVIYTTAGGDMRPTLSKIARMQGIDAEMVSGRSGDILPRVTSERRAGLYLPDIYLGGPQSMLNTAKPAGLMESLDSLLVMPHLTDPEVIKKVWFKGALPWADRDHTAFIIALQPAIGLSVSTNLVKPDEIKSWRDLLNPKWGGLLAYNDPTVAGYGAMAAQAMAGIMGDDFLAELAKAKPIIMRDERQQMDWLAHGKLAIVIAPRLEMVVEFLKVGAPIKPVVTQEGTWLGPGMGGMVWFKNAPHVNASKVFINWLTTKEAQDVFAPAGGFHSTREDATTAHLLPGLARSEGVKYFAGYTEEAYAQRPASDKRAKDLFGPLIK